MKYIATIALCVLGLTAAQAQIGDTFPALEGQTLEETPVTLPDDSGGKYTLVVMAYSRRAEQDLESWFQPIYRRFLQDRQDAGLFAAFTYDINVYFIPMFTGAKRVASARAFEDSRRKVDYRLHPNVLFYVGGLAEYRDALEFEGRNKPYLFLLDEAGTIVYTASGEYTADKIEAIESFLDNLE